MTAPRPRFTVRRLMLGVAGACLLFATMRIVNEFRFWTFSNGWNTSLLDVGQRVMPCVEVRIGDLTIPAETPCIVIDDPPDEDSAYPDREVLVRITEGQSKGIRCGIPRSRLRVRGWP